MKEQNSTERNSAGKHGLSLKQVTLRDLDSIEDLRPMVGGDGGGDSRARVRGFEKIS